MFINLSKLVIETTAVYNALRPDNPNNDFRVAVAAVHYETKDSISRSGRKDVYIINRCDSKK